MTSQYSSLKEIVGELPVKKGDILWVAADLTRLAIALKRSEGHFSADELIDLLKEKTGNEGTLVIPAFNHTLKSNGQFDIKKTRPVTGALSIVAFGRPDFKRTRHPLHSFMVWGKHADSLAGMDNKSSFSNDSPFKFLLDNRAKAMLIGTSVAEAFTFTHFVEEQQRVSYRRYKKYHINYTGIDGETDRREYLLYAKKPGWTMCLAKLQALMEENDLILKQEFNGIFFSMINLEHAYDLILGDINNNKARNIACFSTQLFMKGIVKSLMQSFIGYQTVSERITR